MENYCLHLIGYGNFHGAKKAEGSGEGEQLDERANHSRFPPVSILRSCFGHSPAFWTDSFKAPIF